MTGIPDPLALLVTIAGTVVLVACAALAVCSPFLMFRFFADVRRIRTALERLAEQPGTVRGPSHGSVLGV